MNPPVSQRVAGLAVPALLGLFLVGTSGFEPLPELGVFNGKRVLEALLLLLLLVAVALPGSLRHSFAGLMACVPGWAAWSLGLAGLAGTLSALRFPHPGYGLLDVAMLALLALAIIATGAARRIGGDGFDRLAVLVVCAIGLIAAVTEFTGLFAVWMAGFEFKYDIMLVRFFHPRFYNQVQTFSIPLIAALPFVFGPSRKMKVVAVVLIALQWCVVLVSGGRGTVVSLVAALTLAALVFPSNRRAWLGIHAAGLLLGAALFLSVLQVNASVATDEGQFVAQSVGRPMAHSSGRMHMWDIAWHQALGQPLLGSGPSRYACELGANTVAHPHSFPMTLLAEWGFPAFLLVMLVSAWLGWRLVIRCRRHQAGDASSDTLVAMLGCSIIAATAHALVSGVLIMPASQVMTVLVGGWAFGRLNVTVERTPAGKRTTALTLAAAIALAAWVSVFSISEARNMEFRTGTARMSEA